MTTISIIELKNERLYLNGYRARKNGKLVFVALFDYVEWKDETEINETLIKYPQRAEIYKEIKEDNIIIEQNLERINNSNVLLEYGEILELKIVRTKCKKTHPSLKKSCNDENESRRIILLQDNELRNRLRTAQTIIDENITNLFKNHSNLIGTESCWVNGDVGIRLVVSCKHYIPDGEPELPEYIGEFRTFVRQGWFKYC
jgi:hypothetical protein